MTYDGIKQKKKAPNNATMSKIIPGERGVAVIEYMPPDATPAPLSRKFAIRLKRYNTAR